MYARTDDSDPTTFGDEAIKVGEQFEDLMDLNITTWEETDTPTEDGSTSIGEVSSMFDSLQACKLGTAEISIETQVAATANDEVTPTVSVEVMTETEVAEVASNETSAASADRVLAGRDNSTSKASSFRQ